MPGNAVLAKWRNGRVVRLPHGNPGIPAASINRALCLLCALEHSILRSGYRRMVISSAAPFVLLSRKTGAPPWDNSFWRSPA